ncbi:unnamed protein product [Musa acuminata subsp. malaccensis]|nr:unnamed protein product [Musa acuminata subsp. malaccensis]
MADVALQKTLVFTSRGRGRHKGACDFSDTATLTTTDPSYSGCTYPATPSAAGTSSTSTTSTPGTTASSITPTNGLLGGLGPSSDISTDIDHGGFLLKAGMSSLLIVVC